jgi:hypothetical protein
MDIATQAIQLCHHDWRAGFAGRFQGRMELRSPGVIILAALLLDEDLCKNKDCIPEIFPSPVGRR